MTYGIIGAMDEEISYLESQMVDPVRTEVANVLFLEGKIKGTQVVLLKSGIGKVNAAIATTILIERFSPDFIINTGSAGGFAEELNVGDIVIGTEIVHHDVDVTVFDYAYGQVPQLPARFVSDSRLIDKAKKALSELELTSKTGLIATGDSFMSDPAKVKFVHDKFPEMLAAEMEGAAIAQVCHQYDVPFAVIRALSDIAGKESSVSFNEFLTLAAENAAKMIIKMIEEE